MLQVVTFCPGGGAAGVRMLPFRPFTRTHWSLASLHTHVHTKHTYMCSIDINRAQSLSVLYGYTHCTLTSSYLSSVSVLSAVESCAGLSTSSSVAVEAVDMAPDSAES